MVRPLAGSAVAMLVTTGFEQVELTESRRRLSQQGARVELVSLKKDRVRAWNHNDWGEEFDVDVHIDAVDAAACDALILPGGVLSADLLRLDRRAVDLVANCVKQRKVVGAIGHGSWLLIEAGCVAGRQVTSYLSLRTDLVNAGASWRDAPVVVDERLVFSRWPDDLDAFLEALSGLLVSGDRSV